MTYRRGARSRALLAAPWFACALLTATPQAVADEGGAPSNENAKPGPSELAREGVDNLLKALDRLIGMIPQYEMPEVLENGDIIIRRRNPEPEGDEEPAEPKPDVTETRT